MNFAPQNTDQSLEGYNIALIARLAAHPDPAHDLA